MNPSLVITVLVLLSGFALLSGRLRRASAGRAPAWAFVLAACVPGLFLGVVATGVSVLHEPSWKPILPLICDGRIENSSRTSSYQAPMSHTHDAGLTTVSTMLYCVDANGDRQPVIGRFMAASTLVYGGAFSLLLLWLFTRRRPSPTSAGSPATTPVGNTPVTVNGRTVDAEVTDKVRQLARRLTGSSPHNGPGNTFVTVNGQDVDGDTANDVAQLVARLIGSSRIPAAADEELHHLLDKARIVQAVSGEDLDARLRQLKHLHEQRLITGTEYTARKADMLSQL